MTRWRWAAAAVLTAAVAGCGAQGEIVPASGPNQTAANRQADLDTAERQAKQDYDDAMQNFEDVVLTVPGDRSYTIVDNAMMGEMWPGQWETGDPGAMGPCMWTLLSPAGDLIDNGAVRQGETGMVTITEIGSVFHSFDCADWRRIG